MCRKNTYCQEIPKVKPFFLLDVPAFRIVLFKEFVDRHLESSIPMPLHPPHHVHGGDRRDNEIKTVAMSVLELLCSCSSVLSELGRNSRDEKYPQVRDLERDKPLSRGIGSKLDGQEKTEANKPEDHQLLE